METAQGLRRVHRKRGPEQEPRPGREQLGDRLLGRGQDAGPGGVQGVAANPGRQFNSIKFVGSLFQSPF